MRRAVPRLFLGEVCETSTGEEAQSAQADNRNHPEQVFLSQVVRFTSG